MELGVLGWLQVGGLISLLILILAEAWRNG